MLVETFFIAQLNCGNFWINPATSHQECLDTTIRSQPKLKPDCSRFQYLQEASAAGLTCYHLPRSPEYGTIYSGTLSQIIYVWQTRGWLSRDYVQSLIGFDGLLIVQNSTGQEWSWKDNDSPNKTIKARFFWSIYDNDWMLAYIEGYDEQGVYRGLGK